MAVLSLPTKVVFGIDVNGNGLEDTWEQLYDAGALQLTDDEDSDSFSNLEECIAGTDPYDANDRPEMALQVIQGEAEEIRLLFDTRSGKDYTVVHSTDLIDFDQTILSLAGDDDEASLLINTSGLLKSLSPIRIDFWANLQGTTIDALYSLGHFPSPPDGSIHYTSPEAPVFKATGYGARMTTWITPPQTGDYTFFLSAGGPAELYLRESDASDPNKIAEILPAQTGIAKGEWDTYSTQRSDIITLIADTNYFLDLRYVSTVAGQHVQIAWSGPGITGIQPLSQSDLATLVVHSETVAGSILFEYDYDSTDQTDTLWPQNTEIVAGITGMSGNAERIIGDVGSSSEEERININPDELSYEHLYATWLFNMAPGEQDTRIFFQNGSDGAQEGPRIDIEDQSSGTVAAVRAGGSSGSDITIDVEFDKTFRIEMLATLASQGFEYETPSEKFTVSEDTFDIYVSDLQGNLIGSARGLDFRDGPGVVQALNRMRLPYLSTPPDLKAPKIVFDDWEFTSGLITGKGYLRPNTIDYSGLAHFFRLEVKESDQDGDNISDWAEIILSAQQNLLFFDSETVNGSADGVVLTDVLAQSQGLPEVELYGTDAAAFESNYPNTIPDDGEITINRTGTLAPLTIQLCITPLESTGNTQTVCDGSCCMLIGSAGDEEAEPEDYELIDENGTIITDTLTFEFGEMQKVLTVKAVNDEINEYPETLNMAIAPSFDGSYTISSTTNGASIQLFDLPDNADNVAIFTGTFSQDGAATTATSGSGFLTATLNGPRTELRIWNEFSGLTSAQQDAHVHKSDNGNPGPIIYEITNIPGDSESNPYNGPLEDYPWDLNDSSGAIPSSGSSGASKQVIIDSLFGQNGESPLYLNIHTEDNPAGEIWAFFNLSGGGSIDEPDPPTPAAAAGSAEYPQLTGDQLESEVRRFLNQATFGATESAVANLLNTIDVARQTDPNYHRHQAYSDWIDEQMDPAIYEQTYLLDLTLADTFQMLTLAGIFDPALNPTDGVTPTPIRPEPWPTINRDDPNPAHWYLSSNFPVNRDELELADNINNISLSVGNNERRHAHWQTMLNAKDQLRQKMGFALQQIVVVSVENSTIRDSAYGSANYQDLINTHAFDYYRDILGFVNWSPIMGRWLSSLQNQKAADLDGDGLFDTFPDENLARENMQLFSIGLFQIWPDGTLRLSYEGLPQPTYTNADIREFAKILTGQSFSQYAFTSTIPTWGGEPFVANNDNFFSSPTTDGLLARSYLYPMVMFGDYHSLGAKSFAGTTIDNTHIIDPTQQGIADIEAAIDWLAGKPGDGQPDFDMVNSHVSTPAFISRRLIQRFTTSNPSSDYLHRVATVFKDSEGNLGLTLKAILLDPEARTLDINNTTFGMKKSPLEAYIQMLRALEAYTYIPLTNPDGAAPYDEAPGDYTNADLYLESFQYPATQLDNYERNVRFMPSRTQSSGTQGLQMDPFRQPSVFNYYLSDYSPGGVVGNAGLVAPELQLVNESDAVRNINYFHDIIRSSTGPGADELGVTNIRQNVAFGFDVVDTVADDHDRPRLPFQQMVDAFYPASAPTPVITGDPLTERSSESLADEALLDALDRRLTCGWFKLRYPYDRSDDDDPDVAGEDDLLKNPRELIIDAITAGYSDPYNGDSDNQNRIDKLEDALYLLTLSPEYQIKK